MPPAFFFPYVFLHTVGRIIYLKIKKLKLLFSFSQSSHPLSHRYYIPNILNYFQVPQTLWTRSPNVYMYDSLIPFNLTSSYPSFPSPLRHHSHQEGFLDFLLGASPMNAYIFQKILSYSSHHAVGISCVFLCNLPLTYKLKRGTQGLCFSK